uniref:Uncharacterized protein n=1 Tax=Romanomermis culicivorax TaxID=13658 RepID=A0A915JH00_ROMCU
MARDPILSIEQIPKNGNLRSASRSKSSRPLKKARLDSSTNRVRSSSRVKPRTELGIPDQTKREKAQKLGNKAQSRIRRNAKAGEADRRVFVKLPKHLYSGKRKMGKTDRR